MLRAAALALLAAAVLLGAPDRARAQAPNCTFSILAVNFSNVDVTSSANTDVTSTLSANCTGGAGRTVRICPHLGAGGGGSSGLTRQMKSGADALNYNLYTDGSRVTVWGSGAFGGTVPQIDLALDGAGSGSTSRTIYARVPGSQGSAPVGSYTSSFAGHAELRYADSTAGDCATMAGYQTDTPSFTVQATVQAQCTVSATPVSFGTAGILAANVDADGTLSLVCTRDAAYSIGLGAGQNDGGIGVSARKMKSGANAKGYQLYQDVGRSLVWGNTPNSDMKGGTGTGSADEHKVYGRVPPQVTPPAGTYADTVVVTVTY